MNGDTAFGAWYQLVAQADVGEGAAHHDFVISAPCAILIKINLLHTLAQKIFTCWRVFADRTGGLDMVRRHRITQQCQHAGTANIGDGTRLGGHAFEVGRVAHVGGVVGPRKAVAGRHLH